MDNITQKNLTVKKLIQFIDKDFYKKITNKYELIKFTKLIVKTFCEEHDVPILEVEPSRCRAIFRKIYACYNYYSYSLFINNKYFKCFDHMREKENFYFVAHYFDSIFHELRHHIQYSTNLKNENGILKNFVRLNRMIGSYDTLKKYSYYCSPDELDARHYSYSLLIKNKTLAPYFRYGDYIEKEINNEIKDPMDYVSLLKNKNLRALKYASLPLKNIESEVKDIAKLNNLVYVDHNHKPKKSPFGNINEKHANNIYLSLAINERIAPLFNSPEFTEQTNGPKIEKKIKGEMIDFEKNFNDLEIVYIDADGNEKIVENPDEIIDIE